MYQDKEKQREYQRKWVRQKRGSTSEGSTEQESVTPVKAKGMTGHDGRHSVPMGDMDPHMRRSWDNVLAMYQADPEKVRRIVKPVCDLKDTVGGETRNAGDCTRWGCYGPTYSDVARILGF